MKIHNKQKKIKVTRNSKAEQLSFTYRPTLSGKAYQILYVDRLKIGELSHWETDLISDKREPLTIADVNIKNNTKHTNSDNKHIHLIHPPKNIRNIFGDIMYYKEGTSELHRSGGPAIEKSDGTKEWWFNGKRHRKDGPAIQDKSGYKEWWFHGVRYNDSKELNKVICINKELRRRFREIQENDFTVPKFEAHWSSSSIKLEELPKQAKRFDIVAIDDLTDEMSREYSVNSKKASISDIEGLQKRINEALTKELNKRFYQKYLKFSEWYPSKDETEEELKDEPKEEKAKPANLSWGTALGALVLVTALKSTKKTKKVKIKEKEEQRS